MAEALRKKEVQVLSDGSQVFFEPLSGVEINPHASETSIHEAWHVLAALLLGLGVKEVTNIPDGPSEGSTSFNGYDARVFAAAHAMGCRGGSHDLAVITMVEGSTGESISAAKSLLKGPRRYKQMLAIATLLDKRRRMGGGESMAILQDVTKEQDEGELYVMRVIRPDGTEQTSTERIKGAPARAVNELVTLIRLTEEPKEKKRAPADILVSAQLVKAVNDN